MEHTYKAIQYFTWPPVDPEVHQIAKTSLSLSVMLSIFLYVCLTKFNTLNK